MKSFQVVRTHFSPYQHHSFAETEKKALESIEGVQYTALENLNSDSSVILVTNTHTILSQLPATVLKNTKLIVHPNSGYDHFEKDAALWSDIPVVVGHTIRAPAVAEYTLGCLFQGSQEIPQHLTWDKKRTWDRKLVRDMTIWVYGAGHIGTTVASTLKALGAKVTVLDPYKNNSPLASWKDGSRINVDAHLLCCSLNASSYHMFNEEFFRSLRPDAIIVNGARGKLIDESALKDFLRSHPKAQAFLDVFEEEPFSNEWIGVPQVWKTSHIAGVSQDLDQRILDFETRVIEDFVLHSSGFAEKYKNEILQNKFVDGVLI